MTRSSRSRNLSSSTRAPRLAALLLAASAAGASPALAARLPGLLAEGPAPELAEKLDTFGRLVGSWEFDVVVHRPDGRPRTGRGEWHFAWTLEGRGIQDVWIARYADSTAAGRPATGYGTTIRLYNPELDAWRVVWASARSASLTTFLARRTGDEIVMEESPADSSGERVRWIFSEIGERSFRWRAVASNDGGATWRTEQEMFARRPGGRRAPDADRGTARARP